MSLDSFIYGYLASEQTYEDGDYIIKEGSLGDWVYVVLEGKVKVKKMTPKGLVTVDTLKEGDIFGEMILWQAGKGVRTASVVAEGHVQIGILNSERLLQDYESISPKLKLLIKSLIERLSDSTKKAVNLVIEAK